MLAQVPPCTNFHELPWKSVVDVPWQVVPGPAAQSFWPFSATPKHFSLWAATAASPSALVSGAAAAMVASAVVTAPARTNELTSFFADIGFLLLRVASPAGRTRIVSFVPREALVTVNRSRIRETTFGPRTSLHERVPAKYRKAEGQLQCLVPIATVSKGHWK